LTDLAANKRVAHIGFVDANLTPSKQAQGTWLHGRLDEVARELVGLDVSAEGVQAAGDAGYDVYMIDCQDPDGVARLGLAPAELVVAGEVLEHLDSPGDFLDAMRILLAPGGWLVLTTPNALRLTNVLGALLGREFVSPEHLAWQSPQTIRALLNRHGFDLVELSYYANTGEESIATGVKRAAVVGLRGLLRLTTLMRPALADGLFVVAAAD
jgi:predicted TPR repeat methyltransferase